MIPAGLNSYRFPAKALEPICGLPMIEHVYKRAMLSTLIDEVYGTTPDQEIIDVVEDFGGASIKTTDDVRRASDRVAQATSNLNCDIVANLQGDEPLVMPAMLDRAVRFMMDDSTVKCVNVVYRSDY